MTIHSIFFNELGRLRSGWRFAIFLLLFSFFGILFKILSDAILSLLPIGHSNGSFLTLSVASTMQLSAAILAGWLCGKYIEDLPFRALGLWFTKNWFRDLALGLIFGAAAVSLAVLIAAVFGGLSFSYNLGAGRSAILITLGISFVIFGIAAAFEEVLFRGYIFQTFARAGLGWLAITLTSIFFGLVHLGNPGSTLIATVNTILAGILFSLAYLKTRTLWFVFGLHFFWNWVQGSIFGIEVSGLTEISTAPFLTEFDRGPIWLTGENYGIEGGVACTIALIIFIALVWFLPLLNAADEMLELTSTEKSVN